MSSHVSNFIKQTDPAKSYSLVLKSRAVPNKWQNVAHLFGNVCLNVKPCQQIVTDSHYFIECENNHA
jgi:hypothetical protein